jgi:outer membrane receptor protein involved in Fe transport
MKSSADHAVAAPRQIFLGALTLWLVRAGQVGDLTGLSLEQLLEVPIVGASKYEQKQSEVPAAVSVITRQEIKAFGWRTLGEALSSLPGVYTTYDRQYLYLGARGFGLPGDLTTRVLVAINGNRINDPTYDGGPVGGEFPLDIDLVERIEFIPGPGGAVYGQNAMLGVVNVITRRGVDVGGTEVAASYQSPQSLGQGRVSWGGGLGRGIDALVSVSGLHADGEDRFIDFGAARASGVAVGLDGGRDAEFFARISGGPWALNFVEGNRRKDDPTGSYLSDPLVQGQHSIDRYTLADLQFESDVAGDTLHLSGRVFAGRYRFRSQLSYSGTSVSFPAAGDWLGADWRLISTAAAHHKLMIGLETQDNARTDQSALYVADPASNIDISRSGYRVGVYAQDEWRIKEPLLATIGLRIDRNNRTGTEASPRAALIWQARPSSTLKALYGRAHRAPNSFERDYEDGLAQVANPALKGERIETLEFVVDHLVGKDLAFRGSVYQWTMHNLITLGVDPLSQLAQFLSGERVRARGLEFSGDKTFASSARIRGSVSTQDVTYATGVGLINSPKVLGKFNVSVPLARSGLRAAYELRYDSERLTLDGTRLGGYALSNLNLSTKAVTRGLELSVGVYNLFDRRYDQPLADTNWQNALEQDGRSVQVALRSRF